MTKCLRHTDCPISEFCDFKGFCEQPDYGDPCNINSCQEGLVCDMQLYKCLHPQNTETPKPNRRNCSFDSDCHKDKFCEKGKCIFKKEADASCDFGSSQCKDGLFCGGTKCIVKCFVDSDCPTGYDCSKDPVLEWSLCQVKTIAEKPQPNAALSHLSDHHSAPVPPLQTKSKDKPIPSRPSMDKGTLFLVTSIVALLIIFVLVIIIVCLGRKNKKNKKKAQIFAASAPHHYHQQSSSIQQAPEISQFPSYPAFAPVYGGYPLMYGQQTAPLIDGMSSQAPPSYGESNNYLNNTETGQEVNYESEKQSQS